MNHGKLLDVREIERELERFVRGRFAQAELRESSVELITFDEDANEITIQEVVDRMSARDLSSVEPGETHYAQMLIEGPLRGSGVVDGLFSLRTTDWEFQAEAAGRERSREPSNYRQKRLTVTEGTHRFVRGLKASHSALVSSEE